MQKILLLIIVISFSTLKSQNIVSKKISFYFNTPVKERYLNYILTEDVRKDSIYDLLNKKNILPFYAFKKKIKENDLFSENDKKHFEDEKKKKEKYLDSISLNLDKKQTSFNLKTSDKWNLIYDSYRGKYKYLLELNVKKISSTLEIDPINNSDILDENKTENKKKFSYNIDYSFNAFTLTRSDYLNNYYVNNTLFCKEKVYSTGTINFFNSNWYRIDYFFKNTIESISNEEDKKFLIHIYENVITYKEKQFINFRKINIIGNKYEAIKYLLKFNIDYNDININDFNEKEFSF